MILDKYNHKNDLRMKVKYDSPKHLHEIITDLKKEYPTLKDGVIPTTEFMVVLLTVENHNIKEEIKKELEIEDLF